MKYSERLLKLGCFSREQAGVLAGNVHTGGTLLSNYLRKGHIRRVRHNLYVAMSPDGRGPALNKFQIARHLSPTSYVCRHSAFEYHGFSENVSNLVEVSSETPFGSFEFDGVSYVRVVSKVKAGVATRPDGVRVTDGERTVLDGIRFFHKFMGLGELLRGLAKVPGLDERVLLKYLKHYGKQHMYQKTGYVLGLFKNELGLSDDFFGECRALLGKSIGYLQKKAGTETVYDREWRLVVPKDLLAPGAG